MEKCEISLRGRICPATSQSAPQKSFKVSHLHIASIDKSSTHINVSDMILNIAKYGILTNILMRYSPAAALLAALVADAQQSEAKVHFLKVYK